MGTAMCAIAQVDGSSASVANPITSCGIGPCSGACKRFAAVKAVLDAETAAVKPEPQFPIAIDSGFTAEILKPYRQNATYLKSAEITEANDKSAASTAAQRLI